MDFRQTTQSNSARPADATPSTSREPKVNKRVSADRGPKWLQFLYGVALIGVVVLLIGILLGISRGSVSNEFQYVNKTEYQAVFLNNGQVYFGHVNSLNSQYVRMNDVYYLTQSAAASDSSSASNSYTLLQLGCQQIHYPENQMVINRDQVTFWENLNSKGQVVTKIGELKKQGVDCSQVTSQTQAPSSTNSQGSSTTPQSSTGTNGSSSTSGK